MSPLDIGIVLAYLAAVFGIGIYFSRNQKTTEDYFLAGRKVPGWVFTTCVPLPPSTAVARASSVRTGWFASGSVCR